VRQWIARVYGLPAREGMDAVGGLPAPGPCCLWRAELVYERAETPSLVNAIARVKAGAPPASCGGR
jgi:hypothetical protein